MIDTSKCRTYADYDAWCRSNMIAWNRVAVTDPVEWERIACRVDARRTQREERRMSDWQSMETAPQDGTAIQARIPGHGSDNIIGWIDGLQDSRDNQCGGWAFMTEQEPPDSWTDGVCWEVNEDGVASVKPTHWKSLDKKAGGASEALRDGEAGVTP